MMTAKKIISWKKWRNPYALAKNKKSDDLFDDGYDSNCDVDIADDETRSNIDDVDTDHPSVMFFTPVGPVPLTENNDPEKLFNFWMGHTNFNITPKIKKIINDAEGVETLNVYTRYRLRVGIGHMFAPQNVLQNINREISYYFQQRDNAGQQESDSGPTTGPEYQLTDE